MKTLPAYYKILTSMDVFVVAGVVDGNNDEVVDVLYRVQAMRLSDAPRHRVTTPGAGKEKLTLKHGNSPS